MEHKWKENIAGTPPHMGHIFVEVEFDSGIKDIGRVRQYCWDAEYPGRILKWRLVP